MTCDENDKETTANTSAFTTLSKKEPEKDLKKMLELNKPNKRSVQTHEELLDLKVSKKNAKDKVDSNGNKQNDIKIKAMKNNNKI